MFTAPKYLITIDFNSIEFFDLKLKKTITKSTGEVGIDQQGRIAHIECDINPGPPVGIVNRHQVLGNSRLLISNRYYLASICNYLITAIAKYPFFLMRPTAYVQIKRKMEPSIDQIEFEAIFNAMLEAGCKKVYLKKNGLFDPKICLENKFIENEIYIPLKA